MTKPDYAALLRDIELDSGEKQYRRIAEAIYDMFEDQMSEIAFRIAEQYFPGSENEELRNSDEFHDFFINPLMDRVILAVFTNCLEGDIDIQDDGKVIISILPNPE